jgi:replication factor C small subunit
MLLVEKYRPKTIDELVGNEVLKDKFREYITKKEIPNILLSGKPGGGKTTAAKIISKAISDEVLFINASDENNVDTVRNRIKNFASTVSFGKYKVVVLDEADFLSLNSQAILRRLTEDFSKTTRFILTCNYHEKIIDPIKSRMQMFIMQPLSLPDISIHVAGILKKENVKYNDEDIVKVVKAFHPDIRKIINVLEQNINDENVLVLSNTTLVESDLKTSIIASLSKPNAFKLIRKIIADNNINDFSELYTYLFNNIHEVINNEDDLSTAYIKIAEYMYRDALCTDCEINFMGMISELLR